MELRLKLDILRSKSAALDKWILLILSLLFISWLSQSGTTVFFVVGYSLINYEWLRLLSVNFSLHKKYLGWLQVFTNVVFFIILQQLNLVGVLSASNQSHPETSIVLIGFAFYFLQLLGLSMSILNSRLPLPSRLDFLLAIVYFPKYLSGPIESIDFFDRVKNFRFVWNSKQVNTGASYALTGAVFKFLIADYLKYLVTLDEITSPIGILRSTVAFEFQVYFDFCGYSLMAYGAALAIGIPVILNFDHPFGAKNLPEFWRRWHIGLGRWFHEYVFSPLRDFLPSKYWRRLVLPLIVFILSALWHGPTVNFLIWGVFHGLSFAFFVFINERIPIHPIVSRLHLFTTLLVGRFFFMDSHFDRVVEKINTLMNSKAWSADFAHLKSIADATFQLLPQAQQGSFIIFIGLLIVIADVFRANQENDRKSYGLFDSDWVFIAVTIFFFMLIPLSQQYGFVYGR